MDTNEWCAITHIDFRPSFGNRGALTAAPQAGKGSSLEEGEQVLRVLVAAGHPAGTVDLAVLQQLHAAVWRRPSPPRTRTGCTVPAGSRPGPVRVRATWW